MYKDREHKKINAYVQKQDEYQNTLNSKIYNQIWTRLEKAYPNIEDAPDLEGSYVFTKGICFDKIVWVFLTSALIGDGIEMIFCRLFDGYWMSRSSVLYGPFSIVWGLGGSYSYHCAIKFPRKGKQIYFPSGSAIGWSI